jgi:hypothetical protein
MNLARRRLSNGNGRPQLAGLLQEIGVPRRLLRDRKGRKASVLKRRINHYEVLDTARAAYRARIKQSHPDRGGSHDLAARLNWVWKEIRRRYARAGVELG